MGRHQAELEARAKRRQDLKEKLSSRREPVTGLFNRRAWDEFAAAEVGMGMREGKSHHIFAIDIGPDPRGISEPQVRAAAQVIQDAVRESDFVASWRHAEFAVLLMDSPAETAMRLKARIHASLIDIDLSASIGVEATRGRDALEGVWDAAWAKMKAEKQPLDVA